MKISIVSFTAKGSTLAIKLKEELKREGILCEAYTNKRFIKERPIKERKGSLFEWTKAQFEIANGIIFIGATGIAVRAVAPFLVSKAKDPAVIVLDEKGKFAIPLLSGHLGRGNELTEKIAEKLGAVPVITTATDINKLFAVDVFARKNKLLIQSFPLAKKVSAALLERKEVGFYSDYPIKGNVPKELVWIKELDKCLPQMELGICVSAKEKEWLPFKKTLYLIPPAVTIGIGCKKGTKKEWIEEFIEQTLYENGFTWNSVAQIASIHLKKEEEGITLAAKEHGIPFRTYSKQEIMSIEGEFEHSVFVEEVTGVDNVCERCAVLGSSKGKLIQKKRAANGVTLAVALKDWRVKFEE